MLEITPTIHIPHTEIKFTFIRAPGPGGQNVNKVATGVQLRFQVQNSPSLPLAVKDRLLKQLGKKLTLGGELIIKASRYRTQNRNKQDALERLQAIIQKAVTPPKKRKKTKPTLASQVRRLEKKKIHGKTKSMRGANPRSDI